MSISLCMIVKNEETMLPRCLESVKHFVDEIIVVDTGSTDNTREIAKRFGAKVYEYPWDGSFSNAKNFSLLHASMDWILLMDADDEFERKDTQKLLNLINQNSGETVFFFRTLSFMGDKADKNITVSNLNVRLIKNHRGYHFTGNIHEQIVTQNESIGPAHIQDIRFYHYGYLNETVKEKNKRARNIKLIEKELEKKPDDSFMLFNMATEYYALSNFDKALEYYLKSYENFAPQKGYSPKLIVRIVSCLDLLGRTDEMFRYIDAGLKIYPDYTELEFLRANKLVQTEKYMPAVKSLKKCLAMGESPVAISHIPGIGSYKTHLLLSSVYQTLGDEKKALQYCKKALKSNPEYREAYCHLYRLLGTTKHIKAIKKRFESFLPEKNAAAYQLLSDVFYSLQHYKEALYYLKKAEKLSDNPALYNYSKGVCLFYLGKYREAARMLKKAGNGADAPKAMYFYTLCGLFDTSLRVKPKRYANQYFVVLSCFEKMVAEEPCESLAEDIVSSEPYLTPIFSLLDILLQTRQFDAFDKARQLLNLISDDSVLMRLGKLYYKRGFPKLAYKELERSIKLTGKIDAESLDIMKLTISKTGELTL